MAYTPLEKQSRKEYIRRMKVAERAVAALERLVKIVGEQLGPPASTADHKYQPWAIQAGEYRKHFDALFDKLREFTNALNPMDSMNPLRVAIGGLGSPEVRLADLSLDPHPSEADERDRLLALYEAVLMAVLTARETAATFRRVERERKAAEQAWKAEALDLARKDGLNASAYYIHRKLKSRFPRLAIQSIIRAFPRGHFEQLAADREKDKTERAQAAQRNYQRKIKKT